jgi:mono/diheme cytochrome c family protein
MHMQRYRFALALIAPFLIVACGDDTADDGEFTHPALELTGDPAAGAAIYTSFCQTCHGASGEGVAGTGPAMTERIPPLSDAQIVKSIVEGTEGSGNFGPMAPVNVGSDQSIADVVAYVKQEWGG